MFLCLLLPDPENRLVLKPYEPFNKDQQWRFRGRRIVNRKAYLNVVQVEDDTAEVGGHVTWGEENKASEQQLWHIEHLWVFCILRNRDI